MPLGIGIGLSPLVRNLTSLNQNANAKGFLPTASASENVAAWNALGSGAVIIDTPGVYEIDNTLLLKSNTTYNFCEGVTIKKTGNPAIWTHVFLNEGALTNTHDQKIKFYGNGMRIMVNGVDGYSSALNHIRAQFQFLDVSEYIVDNFYIDDGGTEQFLVNFNGCIDSPTNKSQISNLNLKGNKDGLKINACKGFKITNLTTDTFDDGMSLCGSDYNIIAARIGDVSDFEIDGWLDKAHTGAYGRSLLLLQDSWDDWATATSYIYQESVNHGGRLYRKNNAGSATSSVAPTHTTGEVTGADGIRWMYVQDSTIKNVTVKDGIIKNCTSTSMRIFLNLNGDNTIINKAETAKFNNLTFENITFTPTVRNCNLITNFGIIGEITFKNSAITPFVATSGIEGLLFKGNSYAAKSSVDNLIFDGCTINSLTTGTNVTFEDKANVTCAKMTFVNTTINHNVVGGTFFTPVRANQLTDIIFFFFFINNTYGLIYGFNTVNCSILATRTSFLGAKFVGYNPNVSGITQAFTGVDCTFNTPGNFLFHNGNLGSSLALNLSGSIGTPTAAKVLGSNINIVACDLAYSARQEPWITFNGVTALLATSVTLQSYIYDNGNSATITFEYGLTAAYGSTKSGGVITGTVMATGALTGLTSGTTYHWRCKAVNLINTVYSADQTFTTP